MSAAAHLIYALEGVYEMMGNVRLRNAMLEVEAQELSGCPFSACRSS